jgi:RNA polymerase sigma factor (TIGR02999 family)
MSPQFNIDESPLNDLVSKLYSDLHRIAARHLRSERLDHTLQATALLNEAYVKLSDDDQRQFNNKTHFLAVASRVMKQVLVDHARKRSTEKRGGGASAADKLQLASVPGTQPFDILRINRVLEALAAEDDALAQTVELRYFGGLSAKEIAEVLNRSVHVVRHDIRFAQAWLRRELSR